MQNQKFFKRFWKVKGSQALFRPIPEPSIAEPLYLERGNTEEPFMVLDGT